VPQSVPRIETKVRRINKLVSSHPWPTREATNKIVHPSRGSGALTFRNVTCRDWVTIVVLPQEYFMDTFDDAQRPFPFFKAPISHAVVDGPGHCIRCATHADIRFHDACYDCFRSGEIDTVMDTEFGMATREDALLGRTHGVPLNDPSRIPGYHLTQHPIDPRFPNDRWYHVHVDSDYLLDLLRTPKYHTWQGESWLFCCQRPMVFRGSLPSDIFSSSSDQLSSDITAFLDAPDWKKTEGEHGSHTYYVFTCAVCGAVRYNDDCD